MDRATFVAPSLLTSASSTASSWGTPSSGSAAASSVKPQAVALVAPAPLFPLAPPLGAAEPANMTSSRPLLSSLRASGKDDEQTAGAAVAGALALYRRMRLVERLSPDTFT